MLVRSTMNWAAAFVLMVGLFGSAKSVFAQDESELLASTTAQWWQMMNSMPPGSNPLLDATGAFCMAGQRDPMWFLAGTFFGGPATRTCTVPAGEFLFFPVINNVWFNTPNVCGQGKNLNVAELRAMAAPLIDAAKSMSVMLDGKTLKNLVRIRSEAFATALPADNIYNSECGGPGSVPAGLYSPSVDDGYYVLVKPISVGNHTLHIHAESSGISPIDVTYHLIVAPVQLN